MQLKDFQDLIEKRLSKEDVAEIKREVAGSSAVAISEKA